MRILYLTHQYFPRHIGGTEMYVRGLALRAVKSGHDVSIITYRESPSPDPRDFGVHRDVVDGIPVIEIDYNLSVAPDPARYEYSNPFVADVIEEEMRRIAPDIVHAAHAMKLSGAPLERCRALRLPVVVTLCDYWFVCPRHTLLKWNGERCGGPRGPLDCRRCLNETHGFCSPKIFRNGFSPSRVGHSVGRLLLDLQSVARRQDFLRRVLLASRRIVALSPFLKRVFCENGIPPERIEVLPHGLELEGLNPPEHRREQPVTIVFIGSLVHHKGAHVLLESLAMAPGLDIRCRIHGPLREGDPYSLRVMDLARKDPRVTLMGAFPPAELGRVLAGADLLAMPALWYENEPLVVKAALHMGVPVLASDLGTLPDMIRQGIDGWLVRPDDPLEWADALRSMVARSGSLRIERVPAKSMDEHACEILSIYEQERAGHAA